MVMNIKNENVQNLPPIALMYALYTFIFTDPSSRFSIFCFALSFCNDIVCFMSFDTEVSTTSSFVVSAFCVPRYDRIICWNTGPLSISSEYLPDSTTSPSFMTRILSANSVNCSWCVTSKTALDRKTPRMQRLNTSLATCASKADKGSSKIAISASA